MYRIMQLAAALLLTVIPSASGERHGVVLDQPTAGYDLQVEKYDDAGNLLWRLSTNTVGVADVAARLGEVETGPEQGGVFMWYAEDGLRGQRINPDGTMLWADQPFEPQNRKEARYRRYVPFTDPGDVVWDQTNDWFGTPGVYQNVMFYSPIGQEFIPTRSFMDVVDLHLADFNLSVHDTKVYVEVREATITGPVFGVSNQVALPHAHKGPLRFDFEAVPLDPGELYVLRVLATNGGAGIGSSGGPYSTYPHGRQIILGVPKPGNDLWFRIGSRSLVLVDLDIKPRSCPNPLNTNDPDATGGGTMPVAILGTPTMDVSMIDVSTLELEGVPPDMHAFEDVASPAVKEDECDCTTAGPDGHLDLTLKFDPAGIVAAMGTVGDGEQRALALRGKLNDGSPIEGVDCVLVRGGTGDAAEAATATPALLGVHPNPFNPTTQLRFFLPREMHVRLSVFDIAGRRVATLIDGVRPAGEHTARWDAQGTASGVYFMRMEAGRMMETRRVTLVK